MNITVAMSFSIMVAMASVLPAKAESKKQPAKADVEKALKTVGGDHNPEKMKLNKVGAVPVADTFYHVWYGSMDENFRVLIFDNKPSYLGYYVVEFEPVDMEEGAVLLDSGDSDEEGNTSYFTLRIGDQGPLPKVNIDGTPTPFVPVPKKEEEKTVADGGTGSSETNAAPASAGSIDPEYRDWTVTVRGQTQTFRAIYVKSVGNKVSLKEEKRGLTQEFPADIFSDADKEYLKQVAK